MQDESDVAGPAVVEGALQNVRLTVRDVVLDRASNGVNVVAKGGAQYAARIPLMMAGQEFTFIRGYNWADVRAGAKTVRFINTHLESELSDIAFAQAQAVRNMVIPPGRSADRG